MPKELLQFELEESKATCNACAMAPGKTKTKVTYAADLKCCTFEPLVPNFLVGAILSQPMLHPAGVKILESKISRREFSLPIGMTASIRYQVEFNQRSPNDFGNRKDWLCSYYDRGTELCQIWRYRGSVCTTFFCKSIYGREGLMFWARFGEYLHFVEMALMQEALTQMDFSPRQVSELLDFVNRKEGSGWELKARVIPEERSRKIWNGYYDNQADFFEKCYRIVMNFDRKYFKEALGDIGQGYENRLMDSLFRLEKQNAKA